MSLLLCMPLASIAAAVPTLVDPVARLEYERPAGKVNLLLKVDGLDATGLADKALVTKATDVGAQNDSPKVVPEIAFVELPQTGSKSRFWMLTLDVSAMTAGVTQARWMNVTVGGKDEMLVYTLTNVASAKFSWTVKPVTGAKVEPKKPIPIGISVGSVPATNVMVMLSPLIEKNSKDLITPTGLVLCDNKEVECKKAAGLTLTKNSPTQLWMWGADSPGVYEGTITLSAAEKPEGEVVTMTAYVSSLSYKIGGVAVIFAGALLAWFFSVVIKNLIARDQLLLPVADVQASLDAMVLAFDAGKVVSPAPDVEAKINAIKTSLQVPELVKNGLPSKIPGINAANNATLLDGFKRYVQTQSDWVQALSVVVFEGFKPAWGLYAVDQAKAQAAVVALNNLVAAQTGPTAPTADGIRASVRTIIATMNQVLLGAKAGPTQVVEQVKSREQLQVQIARLGMLGWAFVLLVTTLGGAYILVFGSTNSAGFGTDLDYLQCLLWGLGLPAGTQLLQSTSATIGATFGVGKA